MVKDPKSAPGEPEYIYKTVKPDAKDVPETSKQPIPVALGTNIEVDGYVQNVQHAYRSVSTDSAATVEQLVKDKWGLTVDANKTFVVTFKYNTNQGKPYPAKVVSKTSLTEAFTHNWQNVPDKQSTHVNYYKGGPQTKQVDKLDKVVPGTFDFGDRVSPGNESAHITHSYQGVYTDTVPPTQLSIPPDELKEQILQADFQRSHTEFLNTFWDKYDEKYPTLAKASLVKAAHAQAQEGSLLDADKKLVMRAAGLSPDQPAWADTKMDSLLKPATPDPDIEVGLLKIGRYESTDLTVITDKKGTLKDGKLTHRTLLYVPGNSSPIHAFDSPEDMKNQIAKWAADPVKRESLEQHFKLNERQGFWHAGITETLNGLGAWPKPGHRYKWDPSTEIKIQPQSNVFKEISERQRLRSFADADTLITSKNDVNKATLEKYLNKAAMVALLFAPLALVVPEVGLALDALAIASGTIESGIGADDVAHGKPGGTDRIVFGLLNAATVVVPRIAGRVGKAADNTAVESMHPQIKPKSDPITAPPENPGDPSPKPAGNRVDGSWSDWFGVTETPVDPQLNDNFRLKMTNTKSGPNAESYNRGYTLGNPENITGYSRGMSSVEIKNLALEPERTAEEFGTLVRTLEKRRAAKSLDNFLVFKHETEAAGGTVRGMPQDFYLSNVDVLTNGECAAMSSTMALAIMKGKEDIFIDNLFTVAANPDTPGARAFRNKLSSLHESITYKYHGGQPVRKITHEGIIDELAKATQSTTLKISDQGHGIIAGVKIENNNKLFFLYDPNFGLAKFTSEDSMKKGLESLLNSGQVGRTFKPSEYRSSMPVFEVSTFDDGDFYMRSGEVNPTDLFSRPL